MKKRAIDKLEISRDVNTLGITHSLLRGKTHKKSISYWIVRWLLDRNQKTWEKVLCDFVNETNGRQIIEMTWKGPNDEVDIILNNGLTIHNLQFKKGVQK